MIRSVRRLLIGTALVFFGTGARGAGFDGLVEQAQRVREPSSDARDDPRLARAVSDKAIAHRRGMVIRASAEDRRNRWAGHPKHRLPVLMCQLAMNANDKTALEHLPITLAHPSGTEDSFGKSSLARVYCRFPEAFKGKTLEALRKEVAGSRIFLTGGTENHCSMRRVAGYLFGERFPNEKMHYGLTGKELARLCRTYMRDYGRSIYATSQVEYLSPTYHAVNTSTWINIAEFARDDAARLMGQAILDYLMADYALNYSQGQIVAPVQRAKGLFNGTQQRSYAFTTAQWTGWLFWGGGNTPWDTDTFPDKKYLPLQPYGMAVCQHAVSAWDPHPVLRNLGAKRVRTPYMILQSRGDWHCIRPTHYNPYGRKPPRGKLPRPNPRYEMRSVYVDRDYAVGASYRHENIMDPVQRTAIPFSIVWKSADEHNRMLAVHPFWYTAYVDEKTKREFGDEDWMGVSPFMRMVHWENAVIVMWDIPETDPYEGKFGPGSKKFASKRHPKQIRSAFLYVPETVDQKAQASGIFFVREGDVYTAIRPLATGANWQPSIHDGYMRLALPGATVGAAIEVGDKREFGSFDAFQKKIAATTLDVSKLAERKRAVYTSTRGDLLDLRHKTPNWLPDASVNGVKLDFARWPTCESPYVTCRDRVLDVNDGHQGFTVDWRGDLPKYAYYDITPTGRKVTKRMYIKSGELVTE